jgi:protein arginine N-methyltransferase 5
MFNYWKNGLFLKEPIQVKANDKIEVHFWRIVTAQKVFYEWSISSPECSVIHNPNGRTYWIGLH